MEIEDLLCFSAENKGEVLFLKKCYRMKQI